MTKRRVVSVLVSALIVLAGILTTGFVAWTDEVAKTTRESFKIKVNYDLSLAEMIAAGKYGDVDDHYFYKDWSAVKFQKERADITIVLVRFLPPEGHPPTSGFRDPSNMKWAHDPDNRELYDFEVLKKLDAMDLEPATLPELLAFGATYPQKQRQFPIIALGSTAETTLGESIGRRSLDLDYRNDKYTIFCRFAAVRKPLVTVSENFRVRVNYDLSLKEMIEAGGYPHISGCVIEGLSYIPWAITSEKFPIGGKGLVDIDIVLVYFGRYVETYKVLPHLDHLGMRPATLPELLAFGATYPQKQRQFHIITMGAIGDDCYKRRSVVNLSIIGSERMLRLDWIPSYWSDGYFAAVRK